MPTALVRPPGTSFAAALTAQQPRPIIDVELARQQHRAYCQVLRTAGLKLIELPAEEAYPDSCFVQDTAVIFGDWAILSRPGAESRRGEVDSVSRALQGRKRLARIEAPGTLEGGDVLVIGSRVYVGLSARTNPAGFVQLRDLLEPQGATVEAAPVSEVLHLLTGCTYLGQGVLLATDPLLDAPFCRGLDVVRVPPEEAYAANGLGVGRVALLPDGCPQTAAAVQARGFQVLTVSLSEFAKADGGITCLSLLL